MVFFQAVEVLPFFHICLFSLSHFVSLSLVFVKTLHFIILVAGISDTFPQPPLPPGPDEEVDDNPQEELGQPPDEVITGSSSIDLMESKTRIFSLHHHIVIHPSK